MCYEENTLKPFPCKTLIIELISPVLLLPIVSSLRDRKSFIQNNLGPFKLLLNNNGIMQLFKDVFKDISTGIFIWENNVFLHNMLKKKTVYRHFLLKKFSRKKHSLEFCFVRNSIGD